MDFRAEYEKWCTDPYFDEATRAELKALEGNDKEIEDRFYRTLEFGTAGLRGVIGAGTNRMNIYTVRHRERKPLREALQSHMIREICMMSLQMQQHSALMQMVLRHMYFHSLLQFQSFHMR